MGAVLTDPQVAIAKTGTDPDTGTDPEIGSDLETGIDQQSAILPQLHGPTRREEGTGVVCPPTLAKTRATLQARAHSYPLISIKSIRKR